MLFKLLITEFQNLHKPDGFPEKMLFLEFWNNGKFLSYIFSLNQEMTSKIYILLVARGTKHMLCSLQYVLSKVNALNLEFQSEQFRLHKLHSVVSTEYKIILSFFIKEEVFTQMDLSNIDPKDKKIHKPFENINISGRKMSLLEEEPIVDQESNIAFRNDCLKF